MGNMGNTGMYQLACEASPNKQLIDTWLNEGRPLQWISDELKSMDDYISTSSISKYKKYREDKIKQELEATPEFQAKQTQVTEILNDSIAKIQTVDLIGSLGNLITDSAEMLKDAKYRDIKINNARDMRLIQQTMLDAISIYGDTMLKAQQFEEINKNPDLLKKGNTTINITVKDALRDVLSEAMNSGGTGYELIDKLRNGTGITGGDQ